MVQREMGMQSFFEKNSKIFGSSKKVLTFATRFGKEAEVH